jgi:hypothetical protein
LLIEAPQSDPQTASPDHSGLAAKRAAVGVLGGIVVAGTALAEEASWSVAALGATDVAALVFVAWVWVSVAGAGVTARLARAEDASRAAAEAVLLGAGAASLLAVGSRTRIGDGAGPARSSSATESTAASGAVSTAGR